MENLSKCLCGKMPNVKKETNGKYTLECMCGFYMPMCSSIENIVKNWNAFVAKNNTPEEIKRIYGYEDEEVKPKRKKKKGKNSAKRKTPHEEIPEEDEE